MSCINFIITFFNCIFIRFDTCFINSSFKSITNYVTIQLNNLYDYFKEFEYQNKLNLISCCFTYNPFYEVLRYS